MSLFTRSLRSGATMTTRHGVVNVPLIFAGCDTRATSSFE
jgi:hypothetical protein